MKVCVLFSGGLDSMYLANRAIENGHRPLLLHIVYHHPAAAYEHAAVKQWAARNADRITDLECITVPVYAKALAQGVGEEGPRYVPGRNDLFVAVAVNQAAAHQCGEIWIGATAEDTGYPDCRPEWVREKSKQARRWHMDVRAPIICMTRKQVVQRAWLKGYDMGGAWSCYQPNPVTLKPCGTCNSCTQGGAHE